MNIESFIVYKPVKLITPDQAGNLGIETDKAVFVDRIYRSFSGDSLIIPEVYKPGAVIEATRYSNGERSSILTFPELKTAIDYESVTGYLGSAPFTGFIAVSEVVGSHIVEPISRIIPDLCVRAEKLKVLEIKEFLEGELV